MRASPLIELTRPVSTAYRSRASLRLVFEAPGKFDVLNKPCAGSPVTMPKLIVGISVWPLDQMSTWFHDPPRVIEWSPLSHVTVSSTSQLKALRELGVGPLEALVRPPAALMFK